MFILLKGEACFHASDGKTTVLKANQGILIPAGELYSFKAQGDENLLLMRIGCTVAEGMDPLARVDVDGKPFDGYSAENKRQDVLFADGNYPD